MYTTARRLHSDTTTSIRVALRSDPSRLGSDEITRAVSALLAALSTESPPVPARAMTQADVARLLACSRWSVRRLVTAGRLTPRRLLGGLVRFDRAEVEALISTAPDTRP